MKNAVTQDSQASMISYNDVVHHSDEKISCLSNQEDVASKVEASLEDIRSILEVIAATGKFWHDWDELKNMLSFQLKQTLAEYPEAQMASRAELQRSSLSGETYPELVKRLDEALLGFLEGPPFTLQRLCEILLYPKGTYRSLSKLALALEKNLLVTTTLTMEADPSPTTSAPKASGLNEASKEPADRNKGSTLNEDGDAAIEGDVEMVDAEIDEDPASNDTLMEGNSDASSTENLVKCSDASSTSFLGESSSTFVQHDSTPPAAP